MSQHADTFYNLAPVFLTKVSKPSFFNEAAGLAYRIWSGYAYHPIERFHVTSSPSRLQRRTENNRHVGVQRDRSFYGNLHEMSDILIILLICVESDKIPLLHKLKQLYVIFISHLASYKCFNAHARG